MLDRKYPVIVELSAGTKFRLSNSSGEVKDANLGFGLSGGKGYLWVSMLYVPVGGQENAHTWWGEMDATVGYCLKNLG